MSFISQGKPVLSSIAFTLNKEFDYCSINYSVLMVIKGTLFALDQVFMADDVILIPPGKKIHFQGNADTIANILDFDNFVLLGSLNNPAIYENIYDSMTMISLKDLTPSVASIIQTIDTDKITAAFFFFIEKLNKHFPNNASLSPNINPGQRTQRILDFVDSQVFKQCSLNETAARLGITPQYLSSFFKKNLSMTFKDYINRQRVRYGLPFIKYTDFSLDALAGLLGFVSTVSMENAITSVTGFSCLEIRSLESVSIQSCPVPQDQIIEDSESNLHQTAVENQILESENRYILQRELINNYSFYKPFSNTWKAILNIGFAGNLASSGFRNQVSRIQESIHFKYGRIIDLLDQTTYSLVGDHIYYEFDRLFTSLDFMVELGLIPFLSMGCRYQSLIPGLNNKYLIDSADNYQHYYANLKKILPVFLRSCINRYGRKAMSQWHFELYYDTINNNSKYLTMRQFIGVYNDFESMIHHYLPEAAVGGPCFNSISPMNKFENLMTIAREEHSVFDFVSYQIYGNSGSTPNDHIGKTGAAYMDRVASCRDITRKFYPNSLIYISEFGIQYDIRTYLNDSLFLANFISWFLSSISDLTNGVGYCCITDLGTRYQDSKGLLFGGYGIFNHLGIPKPGYYAFAFMNKLGNIQINSTPGVIITRSTSFSYQAFLFHCPNLTDPAIKSQHNKELLSEENNTFAPLDTKNVNLTLSSMPPGRYLIKEYRLNTQNGDILKHYAKISDITDLSPSDIECMKELSRPHAGISPTNIGETGILVLPVKVHSLELVLIQIDYNK